VMSIRPLEAWLSGAELQTSVGPAFGAKCAQNGRTLEDAFSVHIAFASLGTSGGGAGSAAGCVTADEDLHLRASQHSSDADDMLSWFGRCLNCLCFCM
jgi:hypothetical protein